jgi:hypothetical protein
MTMAVHPLRASAAMSLTVGSGSLPAFIAVLLPTLLMAASSDRPISFSTAMSCCVTSTSGMKRAHDRHNRAPTVFLTLLVALRSA